MKIIILQHINIEDPGYIKDLMIKDKFDLTTEPPPTSPNNWQPKQKPK